MIVLVFLEICHATNVRIVQFVQLLHLNMSVKNDVYNRNRKKYMFVIHIVYRRAVSRHGTVFLRLFRLFRVMKIKSENYD